MKQLPDWTPEEDAIILRPITGEQAQAALAAAGYPHRSTQSIYNRRGLIDPDPAHRHFTATMLNLARRTRGGKPFRTGAPAAALFEAVDRGLARRLTKSSFRITLGGIAWLHAELGPDWEQHMEVDA